MALTPEDVSNKRFTPVRLREGYDMGEVDQFLDEVEAELARLTRDNSELRAKLEAAQQDGTAAPAAQPEPAAQASEPPPDADELDDQPGGAAAPAPVVETIEVRTAAEASSAAARLLEIATRNADELVAEARTEADQLIEQARASAEQTESEARARAEQLEADARARSESLDSETEERRERLFGDLDRQLSQVSDQVETLRAFEREYRSRLRTYFQQQLETLEENGTARAPSTGEHDGGALSAVLGGQDTHRA